MAEEIVKQGVELFSMSGLLVSSAMTMSGKSVDFNENNAMVVYLNGVADATDVGEGGNLTVSSGGLAKGTTISEGGNAVISGGGTAQNTQVGANAALDVQGGSADGVQVNYWGNLTISDGGTAAGITILEGGNAVLSSGQVRNATLSGSDWDNGILAVKEGGLVTNASVQYGGSLSVSAGGVLSGQVQIANGGSVTLADNAGFDFSVAAQSDPTTALVNDWSKISTGNDVNYTITVAADQARGVYALAGGAAEFSDSITVKTTENTVLGTLAVGRCKVFDGKSYTVFKNDDSLMLNIANPPAVSDYNGSGKSDMVQFVNGLVYVTYDNGAGYVQTQAINDVSGWNVVEIRRDLTGDGFADIQITSDDGAGSTWVATLRNDYLQNGSITLTYQFIGAYDNKLWKYLGSADFNGDGKAEILMVQTEAGKDQYGHRNVAAWVTDETTCEWIDNIWLGALNDGWDVAGTADVTGDGKDNLILRGADGMIGYWAEFGGQPEDVVELKNAGNRVLVTTGDFDGDGAEDFLWQSIGGDEFSTWTDVNGTLTDTAIGNASDLGGNWTFAGVGDYNGDGKDEILWCDTVQYKTAYSEANQENFTNLVALS